MSFGVLIWWEECSEHCSRLSGNGHCTGAEQKEKMVSMGTHIHNLCKPELFRLSEMI